MEFLCGSSANLQQSVSSRAKTSNSKRGIKVTLSKQKSTDSKHQNSTQRHNPHDFSVNSLRSQNRPYQKQYNQSEHDRLRSDQTEAIRFSESQSIQSDLISSYFQKSHQKQCVRKESAILDEQIRKLQLQIYNTRTKITEAKYLAKNQSQSKLLQTIKNSRKSKEKIKHDEMQTKSNKSLKNQNLTMKTSNRRVDENFHSTYENLSQINNRYPVSVIHNKSPTKPMRSQDRSRSPSPPHPSILRQILSSTKKANTKNHSILQNESEFHRKEISLTEQPIQRSRYNSCDVTNSIPKQRSRQNNQQSHNLELESIQAKEVAVNNDKDQNNLQAKKIKSSKKPRKGSTKKRSMSAYPSNHVPNNLQNNRRNQQKSLHKSSEQFVKRKSKVSDFNLDLQMHMNYRKKQKNINLMLSEIQTSKQTKSKITKKGMFTNELLTKTYNLDLKNTAKNKQNENEKKSKEKRKKSTKKNENQGQKLPYNLIAQNTKIHQLMNNSSHHSTIKSKYIKSKNAFY